MLPPQRLNQVFMNILVNAAQAIEEKKEIRISTEVDNGYVEIIISDTGSGMPPDVLYDHGRGEKGTGLGLNITIDVESEVEKGTTFRHPSYRHKSSLHFFMKSILFGCSSR